MDFTALALAATIAQVGMGAPTMTAQGAPTPYGVLGCKQRATTALYVNGATNVIDKGNHIFAIVGGNTTALAWCRGDHVIIVGAGPQAQTAAEALRQAF